MIFISFLVNSKSFNNLISFDTSNDESENEGDEKKLEYENNQFGIYNFSKRSTIKLDNLFKLTVKNQSLTNISEDIHLLQTIFPKFKLFIRLNNFHFKPINLINNLENFVVKNYGKEFRSIDN